MTPADLRRRLERFPSLPLLGPPTIVESLPRLASLLGAGTRVLVKRDDAQPFGFGGNKVRKLALVAGQARAEGADTLITAGAVQSNHARVTAATAARFGMRAVLVVNGEPPLRPTGNALLDRMLGADIEYVPGREDRAPRMRTVAEQLRRDGRHPFEIPIGASTPLGALAFVLAVAELADQIPPPDVIVHATSSGGTQAGLTAGCQLLGWPTRVVGISADDPAPALCAHVGALVEGIAELVGGDARTVLADARIEVDDRFVGEGYGLSTPASEEAIELAARQEAIFLDTTYTAKAMAGLIAYLREGRFTPPQTVLFWHTGGQVALFA